MPRKPANKLENTEKKSTEKKEVAKTETAKKVASKSKEKKTSTKAKASAEKKTTTKAASKKGEVDVTKKKASTSTKAKSSTAKKSTTKTASAETTAKKAAAKKTSTKAAEKKTAPKKATKTTVQKAAAEKTSTKSAEKKVTTKKATKTTSKKSTTRKTSTKKVVTPEEITSSTDLTKKIEILEYYDLPYRYNQTVVKVLAQTPTTLFIYWDISDVDRANFVEQYGENFFNYTKPVLVIRNLTSHYSFEIEIDDFANSWYLHVNDSNCEYSVELGRRPKYYNEERHIDIPNNYLYVTSSNIIDAPNDRILFDKNLKTVYFKDVKTNIITAKDVTSISFLRNMGRIYNLYDLQGDFRNNNDLKLDLRNPSSSNPSSTFK